MSLFKCVRHDIRCGLLRKRWLLVPLLFLIPALLWWQDGRAVDYNGDWISCMLYIFKGLNEAYIELNAKQFKIPFLWLLAVSGCPFILLDYFLDDLTQAGQQILIRCGGRRTWFLSKCVWLFLSCCVYMLLAALTALLCSLLNLSSGELTHSITETFAMVLSLADEASPTTAQLLLSALLFPLLTLWADCMLQMTLCLVVKPAVAFLISFSMLFTGAYIPTPWILGNGAIVQRSTFFGGTVSPWLAAIPCIAVIICCTVIGVKIFERTDILGKEETA